MADIIIRKVPRIDERKLPVFAEAERLMKDISQRAFELFMARGAGEGHALDDWLTAEREICWPAAEFIEREKAYELSVALAGFEPQEVEVTATPRELIVHAKTSHERKEEGREEAARVRWSEFRSNDVYRRVELATDIDPEKVSATLENGLLRIVAQKVESAARRIPVAAAA